MIINVLLKFVIYLKWLLFIYVDNLKAKISENFMFDVIILNNKLSLKNKLLMISEKWNIHSSHIIYVWFNLKNVIYVILIVLG